MKITQKTWLFSYLGNYSFKFLLENDYFLEENINEYIFYVYPHIYPNGIPKELLNNILIYMQFKNTFVNDHVAYEHPQKNL